MKTLAARFKPGRLYAYPLLCVLSDDDSTTFLYVNKHIVYWRRSHSDLYLKALDIETGEIV